MSILRWENDKTVSELANHNRKCEVTITLAMALHSIVIG